MSTIHATGRATTTDTALPALSTTELARVTGGADPSQPPPSSITTSDVAEVGLKATKAVLNPAKTAVQNSIQSVRQFNDPMIKDAGLDVRFMNGALGLFGIDPLKKMR
jgi:hypothetical protein